MSLNFSYYGGGMQPSPLQMVTGGKRGEGVEIYGGEDLKIRRNSGESEIIGVLAHDCVAGDHPFIFYINGPQPVVPVKLNKNAGRYKKLFCGSNGKFIPQKSRDEVKNYYLLSVEAGSADDVIDAVWWRNEADNRYSGDSCEYTLSNSLYGGRAAQIDRTQENKIKSVTELGAAIIGVAAAANSTYWSAGLYPALYYNNRQSRIPVYVGEAVSAGDYLTTATNGRFIPQDSSTLTSGEEYLFYLQAHENSSANSSCYAGWVGPLSLAAP